MVLASFLLGSCSAQLDFSDVSTGRRVEEIIDGTPSALPFVYSLRATVDCERDTLPACSAVVVAPNIALTAAHCVRGAVRAGVLTLVDPVAPAEGSLEVEVSGVVVHPEYGSEGKRHDLAVLRLAQELDLPAYPLISPWSAEEMVKLVGVDPYSEPGLLHRLEGWVRAIESSEETLATEPDPSTACTGDSGGAALLGDGALIGLIRSGDVACENYTNVTLLEPYRKDFIEPAILSLLAGTLELAPTAGQLCGPVCRHHDECLADELCSTVDDMDPAAAGVCYFAPLGRAGRLAQSCETKEQCGGEPCVVSVGEDGASKACHCLAPCQQEETPPDGCSCSARMEREWLWLSLAVGVLLCTWRRQSWTTKAFGEAWRWLREKPVARQLAPPS